MAVILSRGDGLVTIFEVILVTHQNYWANQRPANRAGRVSV